MQKANQRSLGNLVRRNQTGFVLHDQQKKTVVKYVIFHTEQKTAIQIQHLDPHPSSKVAQVGPDPYGGNKRG